MVQPSSSLDTAITAIRALSRSLEAALDEQRGGFACWTTLSMSRRILISDYSFELLLGLEGNLRRLQLTLKDFDALWSEEATSVRHWAARAGGGAELERLPATSSERRDRLRSRLGSFFSGVTATLDQGAAIVAIVTGLNLNVLKASWRDLQVLLGDASKERARLLKAQTEPEVLARIEDLSAELGGSLARSGSPGWLQWAAAMRNSLNHRGDRVTLTYFWRPPRDALRVALLLPRRPEVTDAWAWSRAQEPEELYLQEHASETMSGPGRLCASALPPSCLMRFSRPRDCALVSFRWSCSRFCSGLRPALLARPI